MSDRAIPSSLRPRRPRRRGLSLPEAMISLMICSGLLVSVGAAFVAASNAIQNNDEFTRASQAARVALLHLESEIRAGWVDPSVSLDAGGNTSQLRLITVESTHNPDRTYKYDQVTRQLLLATNGLTTDLDYVLVRNVTNASFNVQTGLDASGASCVSQVGITLTVAVGKNQLTLAGSAAPRRSLPK